MLKFKIGKWYYIEFLDHCKNDGEDDEITLVFIVRIKSVGKNFIRVINWECISKKNDKAVEEAGREYSKVAKSTIIYAEEIILKKHIDIKTDIPI